MKKKYVLLILIIIWMLLIFLLSSMNSLDSNRKSKSIVNFFIEISNSGLITTKNIENINYVFRKIMHFLCYFVLFIIVYSFIKEYDIKIEKRFYISIVICFLYAFTDEFHQTFVDGRTGQIIDVLIDSLGVLAGSYILLCKEKYLKLDKKIV